MLGYYARRAALVVLIVGMCLMVGLVIRHTIQSAGAESDSSGGLLRPSSHVRRVDRMLDEISGRGNTKDMLDAAEDDSNRRDEK